MLLDRVAPESAIGRSDSRWMRMAPGEVFASLQQITPGELPGLGSVFRAARGLSPFAADKPLYAQMLDAGFSVMGVTPLREVVLARPATPFGLLRPAPRVKNRRELEGFAEAGHVKAALGFSLAPESLGELDGTRVAATLRMWSVDARAGRTLRLLWPFISAGGGIFARAWLRALAARAN